MSASLGRTSPKGLVLPTRKRDRESGSALNQPRSLRNEDETRRNDEDNEDGRKIRRNETKWRDRRRGVCIYSRGEKERERKKDREIRNGED